MDKDQKIYQDMYNAAVAFISRRYPEGFGSAAVMRTDEGSCLSVLLPNMQIKYVMRPEPYARLTN